jgi:hypothetical protein
MLRLFYLWSLYLKPEWMESIAAQEKTFISNHRTRQVHFLGRFASDELRGWFGSASGKPVLLK